MTFIPEMYGCVVMSSPEERLSRMDDVAGTAVRYLPARAGD